MIAANGVTARYLDRARLRLDPPRAALARALGSDRRARGRASANMLPAAAGRAGARAVPDEAPKAAAPATFPDLSLAVIKLLGAGEYARRTSRRTERRATSAWRCGDYTHSTAPNRRYPDLVTQRLLKAAMAGEPPPYSADELAALATALHRAGGQRREGRTAGRRNPRRRCSSRRASANSSTRSSPARRRRAHGCERCARRSRDASCRGRGTGRRRSRARDAGSHRCRARLHRLRATLNDQIDARQLVCRPRVIAKLS